MGWRSVVDNGGRNGWWAEKDLRLVVGFFFCFFFLMIWEFWWPPKPCLLLNCLEHLRHEYTRLGLGAGAGAFSSSIAFGTASISWFDGEEWASRNGEGWRKCLCLNRDFGQACSPRMELMKAVVSKYCIQFEFIRRALKESAYSLPFISDMFFSEFFISCTLLLRTGNKNIFPF